NAPGTSDQFQDFLAGDEQLILDDAGNVAFPAYTTGSTTTPAGIWMGGAGSLQPYALQNSPAPGTSTTLAYPQAFVVNPAGTITFHARLNDPAIIREGIWTTLGGALHPIVIDGSPAPVLPGSILSGIGNPTVNRSGIISFSASYYPTSSDTTLSSALWVGDAADPTPRYFSGSVAPGTGGLTFASFNDVDLNNAGKVAFSGYVSGASPSASYGYWSDAGGSLQLVARQGDPAVGMPGVTYSLLDRFNISTSGRVEFTATTLGTGGANHYGIWAGLPGGMELVAADGTPAPGLPGATFTSFSAADLNSSGLLVFEAYV